MVVTQASETMDSRAFLISLDLFGRRILASLIDIFWLGGLAMFYLLPPIFLSVLYNLWEPSSANGTTEEGVLISQLFQTVGVLTLVTIFFCHPGLALTRLRKGTPGQIITGTTITAQSGARLGFGRAVLILCGCYALFSLIVFLAMAIATYAARFIPAMSFSAGNYSLINDLITWTLVAVTFAIALISENRQDLYEIVSRRMFARDPAVLSIKKRLWLLVPSFKRLWLPEQKATILEKCAAGLISTSIIIGTVSSITLATMIGLLAYALSEVDSGMRDLSMSDSLPHGGTSAVRFAAALKAFPGVANVYNQIYLDSAGLPDMQMWAVQRIIALRGEARDYLMRARLMARQHNVAAALADYKQALTCPKSPLSKEERAQVVAELSILEFKEIQL